MWVFMVQSEGEVSEKIVSLPYGDWQVADRFGGKLLNLSSLRRFEDKNELKNSGGRQEAMGADFCKLLIFKGWAPNYFFIDEIRPGSSMAGPSLQVTRTIFLAICMPTQTPSMRIQSTWVNPPEDQRH